MNNQNNKRALFYFNDMKCSAVCKYTFENRGYEVYTVESIEEMLENVNKENYCFFLMDDTNVKSLKTLNTGEAHRVYESVRHKGEKREAKFMFLSYFQEVVDKAKKEGIPAMKKDEFDGSIDDIVGKRIPW